MDVLNVVTAIAKARAEGFITLAEAKRMTQDALYRAIAKVSRS